MSPKRIQRWTRHSSIQVTFDTYGHLFEQAEADAAIMEAIEREVLGRLAQLADKIKALHCSQYELISVIAFDRRVLQDKRGRGQP